VLVAAAVGVGAAIAVAWVAPWELTLLVGWDAAATTLLLVVWARLVRLDANQTRELATWEDESRRTAELVLVCASVASLLGAGFALAKANHTGSTLEAVLIGLGIATVASSWAVVHTVFTLRYAHLYYAEPVGGIDFKTSDESPDYRDFAYVAFTIGMTFQVSDTDITERVVRRTALRHAMLSFLFGAVILATSVNALASLLSR
jgi:uncharacterized membrane protein